LLAGRELDRRYGSVLEDDCRHAEDPFLKLLRDGLIVLARKWGDVFAAVCVIVRSHSMVSFSL
jgi:hypothetical protein